MINIQGAAWLAAGDVCVVIINNGYEDKGYIKSFKDHSYRDETSEIIETAKIGNSIKCDIAKIIIEEYGKLLNIII